MSELQLPRRTAGYCDLPHGERVWICTLNTAQRTEVERKARRYAATECRSLLKGGADYGGVAAEARSLTPAQQAAYLAQQDYGAIRRDVERAHPLPAEPDPEAGQTPEEYSRAMAAWEADRARAERERQAEETLRYEAAMAGYAALSPEKREEACCAAYHAAEFWQAFQERRSLEVLLRAVRDPNDHLQRRYSSLEEVEDLDDAVRQALLEGYQRLDALSPADPPTWPSA